MNFHFSASIRTAWAFLNAIACVICSEWKNMAGMSGQQVFLLFLAGLLVGGAAFLIFGGGGLGTMAETPAEAGVSGVEAPAVQLPSPSVCLKTDTQSVGARGLTDKKTGVSLLGSLNYSVDGKGWSSISGSSTDSRAPQFMLDGLLNYSVQYWTSRVAGLTPCDSDATAWINKPLAQNNSISFTVINDDSVTANAEGSEQSIGSGGAADIEITYRGQNTNGWFTNPDLETGMTLANAQFDAITPYYIVATNMSTTTYDRSKTDLSCTSGCEVAEKSFLGLASDPEITVVWKVEGNIVGSKQAKLNFHLEAKSGQDPAANTNISMQVFPVSWYRDFESGKILVGAEDSVGNLVVNQYTRRIFID